jgi:hypothetical protein
VALEIAPRPPAEASGCDLVVRLLRAHDGAEWVGALRAAGFAGPLAGWLLQDDRDAAANQDIARGMDIVVPAHAARRSALLQESALVLPALAAPDGGEAEPALAERLRALVAALRRAAQG